MPNLEQALVGGHCHADLTRDAVLTPPIGCGLKAEGGAGGRDDSRQSTFYV